MQPASLRSGAERVGRWSVIALGASIPVSTALDNVLLPIVLICFLMSGRLRQALTVTRHNPVSIAALALFALLAIGTLYGNTSWTGASSQLLKYIDLLFVPIFAVFFREPVVRRNALYTLTGALVVTVLMSFALAMGLVPKSELFAADNHYPVPFKDSLKHGILLGFGAFLFVQLAAFAASRKVRWAWITLATMALANIFFLVPGRTGMLLVAGLALYCGYLRWSWIGIPRILALFALFLLLAYSTSTVLQDRLDQVVLEFSSWKAGKAAGSTGSIGSRLEFYDNTLAIIRDQPLFGVGTGGFSRAYAAQVAGTNMPATRNPHNEYMLVAAQLGLVGLSFFLHLFYQQWRLAPRLPSSLERNLARGIVIAIALGCLFNSLLLDHTEGLLFAWLTGLLFAGLKSRAPINSAGAVEALPDAMAPRTDPP